MTVLALLFAAIAWMIHVSSKGQEAKVEALTTVVQKNNVDLVKKLDKFERKLDIVEAKVKDKEVIASWMDERIRVYHTEHKGE
jgi:hypothetical protein